MAILAQSLNSKVWFQKLSTRTHCQSKHQKTERATAPSAFSEKFWFSNDDQEQLQKSKSPQKKLVRQTHAAARLSAQVNPDAQEVGRASCFATLTADTVLGTRRRRNLSSAATVPGDHFQHIGGTCTDTLGAADAGIVNFDLMRHGLSGSRIRIHRENQPA